MIKLSISSVIGHIYSNTLLYYNFLLQWLLNEVCELSNNNHVRSFICSSVCLFLWQRMTNVKTKYQFCSNEVFAEPLEKSFS